MTEKLENVKADRRGFLKIAGIGAVASGAALVTGKEASASVGGVDPKTGDAGYQETEHVKTFYKSARF